MNSDGSEQTWLRRGSSATWSPDGVSIAFHASVSGTGLPVNLCIMNADGSGEVKVTDSPLGDLTPSWSPDGTKIVFHRPKGRGLGACDLWLINPDGTGESRLADAPGSPTGESYALADDPARCLPMAWNCGAAVC